MKRNIRNERIVWSDLLTELVAIYLPYDLGCPVIELLHIPLSDRGEAGNSASSMTEVSSWMRFTSRPRCVSIVASQRHGLARRQAGAA